MMDRWLSIFCVILLCAGSVSMLMGLLLNQSSLRIEAALYFILVYVISINWRLGNAKEANAIMQSKL